MKSIHTLFSACICLMTVLLFFHLETGINASIRGLSLWWEVVFPSLLPFFILSDLLVKLGVVHLIGRAFRPLAQFIFRLPGEAGVVWFMSMFTGFPAGARLTTTLYSAGSLTQREANRLLAMTNHSNPLFITGAVAIGFFHDPTLGLLFAITHYLGSFTLGLFLRFTEKRNENDMLRPVLSLDLRESHRPIGALMGDSITRSVQTLLLIG
ncbi:MAG: nucleoside recognition domain-containing protein, partial [Bacilli bacterium]